MTVIYIDQMIFSQESINVILMRKVSVAWFNRSSVLKKGIYQHYKGNLYDVLDFVKHSETEEEMVLYRALYGAKGLWVRPLKMFKESVHVEGVCMKRFAYTGDQTDG